MQDQYEMRRYCLMVAATERRAVYMGGLYALFVWLGLLGLSIFGLVSTPSFLWVVGIGVGVSVGIYLCLFQLCLFIGTSSPPNRWYWLTPLFGAAGGYLIAQVFSMPVEEVRVFTPVALVLLTVFVQIDQVKQLGIAWEGSPAIKHRACLLVTPSLAAGIYLGW